MNRRTAACMGLLAVLTGALAPPSARAGSSEGGAFRLPRYGARAWGMSGAAIAIVDDESAIDWNPAGLAGTPRSAGVSYYNLVPGVTLGQSQAAFVMPFGSPRVAGVSTHVAGAMFTNLSADLAGGESYRENHLRLAYAFTPEPLVTIGVGARLFMSRSGVPGFDALGSSIDIAGRLSLASNWTVAVVARDAFSRYSYDDGRDYQLEREYVVGLASRSIRGVAVEADAVRSYGSWSRAMLGAESDYLFSHLALRAGVALLRAGDTRAIPSFGASARGFDGRVALHYAANFDEDEAFGTTHRVSLGVRL